ncbi:MAG: hypothetical protein LQ338_003259 [Usnochroma carphineum]|nr:MAG: hypothetical protein LQ338_003259 [Usnochroma carphineum]
MPIQVPSTLLTLTYACTHTRLFRIEEIDPISTSTSTSSSTNAAVAETVLFAPVCRGEGGNVGDMLVGECPCCVVDKGNGKGEVGDGDEEGGWEMVEGEVWFDVADGDGDVGVEVEGDGDRADGEGWWDVLDLDAEAEVESDGDVDEVYAVGGIEWRMVSGCDVEYL